VVFSGYPCICIMYISQCFILEVFMWLVTEIAWRPYDVCARRRGDNKSWCIGTPWHCMYGRAIWRWYNKPKLECDLPICFYYYCYFYMIIFLCMFTTTITTTFDCVTLSLNSARLRGSITAAVASVTLHSNMSVLEWQRLWLAAAAALRGEFI